MSMSRKDFTVLAAAFSNSYADNSDDRKVMAGIDVALANVTTSLRQTNVNFDANKFITAATKGRPVPITVAPDADDELDDQGNALGNRYNRL